MSTAKYPIKSTQEVIPLILSAKEVIFADIESTGFGSYDDITEIGAIRVDIETGKIQNHFSSFLHLKTQKKVPARIEELTHITTQMLEDAPSMETVLRAFYGFVGSSVLSFHNAPFDWRMLQTRYEKIGLQLFNPVICTCKLFKYLHPEEKSANLEAVTAFYGKRIEGHHRAYVDCKWSAACYRKMREELLTKLDNSQLVLSNPNSNIPTPHVLSASEMRDCIIYQISSWEKKGQARIYCSTSIGNIYYDINEHVWNVSTKNGNFFFDVNTLAKVLLNRLGLNQVDFIDKYA